MVQLLETPFVNLVNYASLVTTNAARHRFVAGKSKTLLEFGLRRAQVPPSLIFLPLIGFLLVLCEILMSGSGMQGPDGGISASRYCYVGGFDATRYTFITSVSCMHTGLTFYIGFVDIIV